MIPFSRSLVPTLVIVSGFLMTPWRVGMTGHTPVRRMSLRTRPLVISAWAVAARWISA
jgi:hypothetical protein